MNVVSMFVCVYHFVRMTMHACVYKCARARTHRREYEGASDSEGEEGNEKVVVGRDSHVINENSGDRLLIRRWVLHGR